MKVKLKTKKLIAIFVATIATTNLLTLTSHANEKLDKIPGAVAIKRNFGKFFNAKNSGYIEETSLKGEASGNITTFAYGLPLLSGNRTGLDKKADAEEFVNWLKENHKEYKSIFKDGLKAQSNAFNTAWKTASNIDGYKFALLQQKYVLEEKVSPVIEKIKKETGVDFSKNKALEELAFSTIEQNGELQGSKILKSAISKYDLSKKSSAKKIVSAVQKERLEQLDKKPLNTIVKSSLGTLIKNETKDYTLLLQGNSDILQ